MQSLPPKAANLYPREEHERQILRYAKLEQQFLSSFGTANTAWFSTPGRTEIGGNHTDHNHGRVLAASINLDSLAIAAPVAHSQVTVYSEGFAQPFQVNLDQLDVLESEKGTTPALIRGIAARFRSFGYQIGGFNACIQSDVLQGSGLSSSASIEVLIGTIFNDFFNQGAISPEEIARIGQYAENVYFGKPCGLMDQTACAVGGIITIDFENPEEARIRKVDFDFSHENYRLLVVDTGGNHADLTPDYAAIPAEMKEVAAAWGKSHMREIRLPQLLAKIPELREQVGDRAILRALHFLEENERVLHQVSALEAGDFQKFLNLVRESGNSSFKWLQNIYTPHHVSEQGITLALALSERYLAHTGAGACRVHGGGFAGTIQVFLPVDTVQDYVNMMEPVFGSHAVRVLQIRNEGSIQL